MALCCYPQRATVSKGTSQCKGQINITTFRSANGGASYTQKLVDTVYTGPQWMTNSLETVASDASDTVVLMYSGAPTLVRLTGYLCVARPTKV